MTWYDQVKCEECLENTDKHFQNLEIINFDLIRTSGKVPNEKLKQYQTIDHHEIKSYPPDLKEEIMSSIFRAKREGMYVKKETVLEHFKNLIKTVGRGRFIRKIRNEHYKATC